MSSDEDDFLAYTPLQRSQVSIKESKPDLKPSKLSLSLRKSKKTEGKANVKTTPSKLNSSKVSRAVKKKTPIKSRADQPEENCSNSDRAKWNFLFGSQVGKTDEKPQPLKRKNDSEGESSRDAFVSSQQKRKSVSAECVPESTRTKHDEDLCLHCKFPFNTGQEKSLHSFLCDSKDLSDLPRCPSGNKCLKINEQHFWKFNHSEKSLCTAVKTNTVKNLVEADPSTTDSGYTCNGIAGPSRSRIPAVSPESTEIIVLSDAEERASYNNNYPDSIPLFEIRESEAITHIDKESISIENSHESSHLIQDVELFDDQSTVCFPGENHSVHSSSLKEQEGQENQKSPVNHIQDDNSGSETPDLFNNETKADQQLLKDREGDELIASVVEEAIDHLAMPVMEKVMKWRKDLKEAQASTPAAQKNTQSPDLRSHKTIVQPLCIHLHYHEANPSPSKESGQTSILTYFKPTESEKESCPCGENKTVSKPENIAAWQGLMGRMKKRTLMPLPSVSQSSSSEGPGYHSSRPPHKTQQANGGTNQRWRKKDAAETKTCPFYKYIPDTGIVVDAFSYGSVEGVTAYFLSHFHYDHYCGLRRDFSQPIYCSEITARLVNKRLGVSLKYLNILPMWEPQQVCGVEVTLLDANHCPGAVMFLFKVKPGVTHLHVGDFRAHPSMEEYSALHCPINTLFLDTTYCSPEHVFPTQERMIEKCVSVAQDHHQRNNKTLFVVGSYTIGKERVFKAIASSLNCSIWVRDYKKQVLSCINDREIQARLSNCKTSAKLHVLPMTEVKGQKLKDYLNQLRGFFSEIVGMCPTGWQFTGRSSDGGLDSISSEQPFPNVYVYGIPYSEHSSFSELRQFVQFIKARKIIPTVNNGNQAKRKQMEKYFREWQTTRQIFS